MEGPSVELAQSMPVAARAGGSAHGSLLGPLGNQAPAPSLDVQRPAPFASGAHTNRAPGAVSPGRLERWLLQGSC